MSKIRMFFVLLGFFALMVGGVATSVFAVDKDTHVTKAGKVDVNKATEEELEEIPGIGKVYAKKIIDGRPYKTDADLIKAGIPENVVDKIKHEIKFGKVKKAPKIHKKAHAKTDAKSDSKATNAHAKTDKKATFNVTKTDTSDETPKVAPHKGMVWVNKDTMVYHKEGDRWYGNTKNGEFMYEKDAIKSGARISKQD